MSDVIIRPLDIERDCQKLADLFNESEPAWPGGLSMGLPFTETGVREWMEAERTLATFVAEAGDRIVGFCSFMENTPWPSGQYNSGYLDLLNVHPDYHGNSIGRKLIQATIERSVQEGWVYQTLGTWSANLKAVPAYKKTGHFWRPDSSVWMQNFIPGALQMPLARPFFDRHDWYATYVRAIEQRPDDERWEGLKVYREHWEAEGESLTIWIDREAQAPCAIETDDVFLASIPSEIEPLQGTSVRINWRIQNKSSEPMHVYLHATGADGLQIDHREAFTIPGGLTVEHAADVQVTADAPHALLDRTAPKVRSLLMLNHTEVELLCGLRARAPLSMDTDPVALSVSPGVPSEITLQFHSELERPVRARCIVSPRGQMAVEGQDEDVELPAGGHAALKLRIRANTSGVHRAAVRLVPHDEGLREELVIFAVAPGGVVVDQGAESVRLETDKVRLTVASRLGTMELTDIASGLVLLRARPAAGPPYVPNAFDRHHFALEVEKRDGHGVVHMRAEPEHHDDAHMELTVGLAPTGLVTVEQQLLALGSEPYRGCLVLEAHWENCAALTRTVPLRQGIVHCAACDFPVDADDAPDAPEDYLEPWGVVERDGLVAGVAWSSNTTRLRNGYDQLRMLSDRLVLQRGQRSAVARYALWMGHGDWRAAREALVRWAGLPVSTGPTAEPELRGVVRAAAERPVIATVDDEIDTIIRVDSVAARSMDGTLEVKGAGGLRAEPARLAITALARGHDLEVPLCLQVPASIGRYEAHVRLGLPVLHSASVLEVLRLGTPGAVQLTSRPCGDHLLWTVDNGAASFTVAPDYGPSVISWSFGGREQLISSYPEPQGHAWAYPWYGGIQLKLYIHDQAEDCGNLVGEHLQAEPMTSEAAGLTWSGVRLAVRPERKELRDVAVQMDYATLPGSPLLRAVLRLTNLRPTRQQILIGGSAAFSLGTSPSALVLHGEGVVRRPTPWGAWCSGRRWGALEDPVSGASVLGVCPQGHLALNDLGNTGRELALAGRVDLPGEATREVVWYLYLAPDLEAALAMRALARL